MSNYCSDTSFYFTVSVAIEVKIWHKWRPAVPDASQLAFRYFLSSWYEIYFWLQHDSTMSLWYQMLMC